jgi:hypothetical protein
MSAVVSVAGCGIGGAAAAALGGGVASGLRFFFLMVGSGAPLIFNFPGITAVIVSVSSVVLSLIFSLRSRSRKCVSHAFSFFGGLCADGDDVVAVSLSLWCLSVDVVKSLRNEMWEFAFSGDEFTSSEAVLGPF